MTRIILVRHGHVFGITPERFRGRMELELTDRGLSQARATATYIARQWRPTAIYTSPMARCVATGQQIAEACGASTQVLQELIDLDYGAWQGKTLAEVRKSWSLDYQLWRRSPQRVRFPAGESLQDVADRTATGLRFILKHHPKGTIVMVGHDATNRVLLLQILKLPLSAFWALTQDPCAVNEFVVDEDQRTIVRVNETAHLLNIERELSRAGDDRGKSHSS